MSNLSDKPWLVPGHMYQYDIGWLVDKLLSFETELNTAIDLKTIHYADPIQWDITTQYSPNTVVVDPKTGTAYMSKVPVPAGVLLTNTDYWVVIFNYQRIYDKIMSGVAFNDKDNLNASKDLLVNDLVWYGGDLYRCTRAIPKGTTYLPGTNLTPTTIADCLATYYGRDRMAQVINDTVNVSGNYTLNAGDIAETASHVTIHSTQDMLLDADGNLTEQVTGGKTTEVGGKLTKHITGSREIDVDGDDSVHVNGVTSINRGGAVTEVFGSSVDKRVNGAFTESFEDATTSTYSGKRIVTGNDITLNANSLYLNLQDPVRYRKPSIKDDNFNFIPMADSDGNQYDVLVYKRPISGGINTKIGYNGSFMTNTDLTHNYIYAQGGTYLDGYYYQFLYETVSSNQIIYKINANTGIYTYKEFTNLYHGNGMANDGTNLYITAWGEVAASPYKIYQLSTDLNITATYNIDIPIVNIGYDKVNKKFYGTDGWNVYELILSSNITYKLLFTISGYYTSYTVQGFCVNDGVLFYALSAPESILKINIDGSNPQLIVLDKYVNDLFQLGEMEDLEYVDGRLYTFSYNRSNMSTVQNSPSLLIFGNIGLDNDTVFVSINPRRDTIFVGNANQLKCVGSSDNPFNDTQQAVMACQAMAECYPIYYDIIVKPVDRVYNGFYVVGNCIRSITPESGKPKVKFIRSRNANLYIQSFIVTGKITNTENILIDNSLACLNTIDPISIDILADRCFVSGNYSFISLVGVMGSTQNEAYSNGKVVYSGLTGCFKTYPKTTMYMHSSGAPNSILGVEVAKSITVTTTPTMIKWNRIMPQDVSLAKYSVFLFIINNVGYSVCGNCELDTGKAKLTVKFNNGRFTLSATDALTIYNIIAIR